MKRCLKALLINFFDFVFLNLSAVAALLLKSDFDLSYIKDYKSELFYGSIILFFSYLGLKLVFYPYRVLWQFAGVRDRVLFTMFNTVAFIIYASCHIILTGGYPLSVYIISWFISITALLAIRTAYKVLYKLKAWIRSNDRLKKNVMIIGAGNAGVMLLKDIMNNGKSEYRVACFIDDDKEKIGKRLRMVKIAGDSATIVENANKYDISLIVFAIPSCPPERKAEILNICSKTGRPVKTLPGLSSLVDGTVKMSNTRDIQVEDLLGREPVKLDLSRACDYLSERVVMVTGGGGSIGSELCRQVARFSPAKLIIFDIYENSVYDILNELKRDYPELSIVALIGSVRDEARVEEILESYLPDVIYHAAAHKHVPLMEYSPHEAVKNNVFGTYNMVRAADKYGVGRFIMISTDKAVNPTNVMGATKRICEMIIQSYAKHSKTEFAAVRFGNVLGSNGSVIPLFKKQIEQGGPVTVTDPEMTRFFMTIPEAVSLVIEAGAEARGGEIFVLDMGEPVKIVELAENLIRLYGLVPYKDIEIRFTGLRPGEKLYEETLMKEEGLRKTNNSLIFVGKPIDFDENEFFENLEMLRFIVTQKSRTSEMRDDIAEDVKTHLAKIVNTYKPSENVACKR